MPGVSKCFKDFYICLCAGMKLTAPQRRLLAAEIFGKLKAMEHHASPPSSLIWLLLLVSFGEPLVSFVTALLEGWSDYRKEVSFRCSIVVHHSCYPATLAGGVEGFVLLLSGLGGRYSVLDHSRHGLGML